MDYVDVHPHVISPDEDRYPFAPLKGRTSGWARSRPVSIDELIAEMDANGVAATAVVQSTTAYGYDCSYIADSLERYGDRMVAVGTVDITSPKAVDTLEYWIAQRGLSGVRVFTTGTLMPDQENWINEPSVQAAWDWLHEHDVPVNIQLMADAYDDLRAVITARPGMRVLLDHCGRPPVPGAEDDTAGAALCALAELDTIYLKLTSTNLLRTPVGQDRWLRNAIDAFGAGRIAWGSNYPASPGSYAELLNLARERLSWLDEAGQQQIFAGTARAVYRDLPAGKRRSNVKPVTDGSEGAVNAN